MEARADALVLFGATGDLVRKKLIPAIYELAAAGKLGTPVIGVARSDWDDERIRVAGSVGIQGAYDRANATSSSR